MAVDDDIREIRTKLDTMFERGINNAANQSVIREKIEGIEKEIKDKLHAPMTCPNLAELKEDEAKIAKLEGTVDQISKHKSQTTSRITTREKYGAIGIGLAAVADILSRIFKP